MGIRTSVFRRSEGSGSLLLMSYADPEMKRAYQRAWLQRRRQAWLTENGPCVDCGSWEDLEVDHVDAKSKVSSSVWSWAAERRLAELAKCVVRCASCHTTKTVVNEEHAYGEAIAQAVLTVDKVRRARALYASGGYTWRELGALFEVKPDTLRRACKDWWKQVK